MQEHKLQIFSIRFRRIIPHTHTLTHTRSAPHVSDIAAAAAAPDAYKLERLSAVYLRTHTITLLLLLAGIQSDGFSCIRNGNAPQPNPAAMIENLALAIFLFYFRPCAGRIKYIYTYTHKHILTYTLKSNRLLCASLRQRPAQRERESTCNLFVSSLQSDWQCRAPQTVSMGRHVMPFVSMMAA